MASYYLNNPQNWKNRGENGRNEKVFAQNTGKNIKKGEKMGENIRLSKVFAHYINGKIVRKYKMYNIILAFCNVMC